MILFRLTLAALIILIVLKNNNNNNIIFIQVTLVHQQCAVINQGPV